MGRREARGTKEVPLHQEVEATGVHPVREAEAQVEDQAVPREEEDSHRGTAAEDSPRSALSYRPPGKVPDHHRLLPRTPVEEGPPQISRCRERTRSSDNFWEPWASCWNDKSKLQEPWRSQPKELPGRARSGTGRAESSRGRA